MLRASGESTGDDYDIDGIKNGDASSIGVPHGQLLIDFAEAVALRDDERRAELADQVVEVLGAEGFVDASGVIAVFNSIVRVADACGIPIDPVRAEATRELRKTLEIDKYIGVQPD